MKPRARVTLSLTLAFLFLFPFTACSGDSSGPGEPPVFAGSWTANSATAANGGDVIEQGYDVGMLFIPSFNPAFVLIVAPPEGTFEEPEIVLGFLRAGGVGAAPDDIFFFGLDQEVLSTGKFNHSNDVLTLQLDGGLGFTQLVLAGSPGPHMQELQGGFEAVELVLEDEEGETIDVLEAGGSATLEIEADFHLYQFVLQAPAGTVTLDPFTTQSHEVVETVGRSILLVGALGCELFSGVSVLEGDQLTMHGLACNLGGDPYLMDLVLQRL